MKQYKKTVWVDGQTPVNASNLNKIETALSEVSKLALSPSDLTSLNEDEIKIGSDCGKITFGIGDKILRTDSVNTVNVLNSNGENSDEKSDIAFVVSSSDEVDSMFPGTYSFNKDGHASPEKSFSTMSTRKTGRFRLRWKRYALLISSASEHGSSRSSWNRISMISVRMNFLSRLRS